MPFCICVLNNLANPLSWLKCFFILHIQYTIRESAKVAGLWEKAPYMNQISPASLCKFYKSVSQLTCKINVKSYDISYVVKLLNTTYFSMIALCLHFYLMHSIMYIYNQSYLCMCLATLYHEAVAHVFVVNIAQIAKLPLSFIKM